MGQGRQTGIFLTGGAESGKEMLATGVPEAYNEGDISVGVRPLKRSKKKGRRRCCQDLKKC